MENQITEKLLAPRLDAAVREYLTKLRKDAFLEIKADYIDTGAATGKDTAWVDPGAIEAGDREKRRSREQDSPQEAAVGDPSSGYPNRGHQFLAVVRRPA